MKFDKLYESIFKPASVEEVIERKSQANLEEFKEWVEKELHIKYEDLFKPENINKQNIYGSTPLMYASNIGYTEIVKLLLDNKADVNIQNKFGGTVLIWASINNYVDIVKLLLDHNADVNIKDTYGYTALMWAIKYNRKEIVDLLKQYGAKE